MIKIGLYLSFYKISLSSVTQSAHFLTVLQIAIDGPLCRILCNFLLKSLLQPNILYHVERSSFKELIN